MDRAATGRTGESLVAALLEERGFSILERNARVGRLELDVIAKRGMLLVFVEVRTRTSDLYGGAEETIDRAKQQRIRHAAAGWVKANPDHRRCKIRFDAAGVLLKRGREPVVDYYPDAF